MTIYCGVDFHARRQTICYCDSAGGEIRLAELDHERDDVGGFYFHKPNESYRRTASRGA